MDVNILIVEDEPFTAKYLADFLRTYDKINFNTFQASTLASATAQIRVQPLDIIVLDLNLPDSPALKTLPAIREAIANSGRKTTVIAITGDDTIKYSTVADYGITELVHKPFNLFSFVEKTLILGALNSLDRSEEKVNKRTTELRGIIKTFYARQ